VLELWRMTAPGRGSGDPPPAEPSGNGEVEVESTTIVKWETLEK
jgi:hypothetical protein